MSITLDIRPEVEAELARQATAQGRPLEAYAVSLLEEVAHPPFDRARAQAAAARIRELRRGVTLGDLSLRELIDEGSP